MKSIINFFENEINNLEKSIQAYYKITSEPWCQITSCGLESIKRQGNKLFLYKHKLDKLREMTQCECSKIHKLITFFNTQYESIENNLVYKCKKCGGYFSK